MAGVSSMKDLRVVQDAGRPGQAGPVRVLEMAGTHPAEIDPGDGGQKAHHQLLLAHLQGEDHRGNLFLVVGIGAGILGDVQGQGGLAHGGAGGDDDQVARLETGGHVVQIHIAGGDAGDMLLAVVQGFEDVEGFLEDRLHRHVLGAQLVLGDLVDLLLGHVQQLVDIGLLVVAPGDDLGGHADQPAVDGLFLHDLAVVGDVGRRGDIVHQGGQVGRPAHLIQFTLLSEHVGHGDQVARFALVREAHHGLEDLAVAFPVEVVRRQNLQHPVDGVVVDQDAAQDGHLGFQALGGKFTQVSIAHSCTPVSVYIQRR